MLIHSKYRCLVALNENKVFLFLVVTYCIFMIFYLGAGIFVTTVVAGSVALVKPFTVASRPFLRDVIFYMAAVFWTFTVLYKGHISLGESVGPIICFSLNHIYTNSQFILEIYTLHC